MTIHNMRTSVRLMRSGLKSVGNAGAWLRPSARALQGVTSLRLVLQPLPRMQVKLDAPTRTMLAVQHHSATALHDTKVQRRHRCRTELKLLARQAANASNSACTERYVERQFCKSCGSVPVKLALHLYCRLVSYLP